MAYSDYGGYAYRNGKRVEDRSDATITPDGTVYGTPGSYPGFALIAAGMPVEEVQARIDWPKGHAILGDGPVFVVLYKQGAHLYKGQQPHSEFVAFDWDADAPQQYHLELDGHDAYIVLMHEDNYYAYARFTQPDSTVWHGFSGYGVGAGLEDCGYGYSTAERVETLDELFHDFRALSRVA